MTEFSEVKILGGDTTTVNEGLLGTMCDPQESWQTLD